MKALLLELRIWYHEWAASEIHPLHVDAPWLTLHLAALKSERDALARAFK